MFITYNSNPYFVKKIMIPLVSGLYMLISNFFTFTFKFRYKYNIIDQVKVNDFLRKCNLKTVILFKTKVQVKYKYLV
jgi:hypothetical protein